MFQLYHSVSCVTSTRSVTTPLNVSSLLNSTLSKVENIVAKGELAHDVTMFLKVV